jgi:hypothetical protein
MAIPVNQVPIHGVEQFTPATGAWVPVSPLSDPPLALALALALALTPTLALALALALTLTLTLTR